MKSRVYIETTIPSYLTAWPSRDLIRAAHQQITREWWANRESFELYASRLVVQECRAGDPRAAADRLAAMADIPLLEATPEAAALAEAGRRGCRPHRHRGRSWPGLPAHLELYPHRRRVAPAADRGGVSGGGMRAAADLHAGGTARREAGR